MSEQNTSAEKETSRIEAFSDGVFGVAITLLAVEIAVPKGTSDTNDSLRHHLLALWPAYLAYFASFVQVLFMWMAHHFLFAMLKRTNTFLMLANGFLLLLVVLVPFPAKTLGEYINTDAKHTATIFYSGYFVLISIAFNLLLAVVISGKGKLLQPNIPAAYIKQFKVRQKIGFLCNIFITVIAFFYVWLAIFLNVVMWIYWAFLSIEKKHKD